VEEDQEEKMGREGKVGGEVTAVAKSYLVLLIGTKENIVINSLLGSRSSSVTFIGSKRLKNFPK
jgi:hypothetical protein